MRVAIATVQVPYLRGGAEALAEGLAAAIGARGHPVDIVSMPFRFFPAEEVARAMRVWEEEDLTRLNSYEPDVVICLKFPAYGVKHPAKVLWLCHQHRGAYDLFDAAKADAEYAKLKDEIAAFDVAHLAHIKRRFTISRRVSERLKSYSGLESTPLHHPPPHAGECHTAAAQPYVFFPSRIEHSKRQELLVRAMPLVAGMGCAVFAGEGGQSGPLRELAEKLGVAGRVRFVGRVTKEELLALYANAAAVCFTPLDEDYGYVTLEAMLSSKAVITCSDSGGALEFMVDGETGLVVEPDPAELAGAISRIFANPSLAARMGRAARAHYQRQGLDWNKVVDKLLPVK